jgi:hypothetical protein
MKERKGGRKDLRKEGKSRMIHNRNNIKSDDENISYLNLFKTQE